MPKLIIHGVITKILLISVHPLSGTIRQMTSEKQIHIDIEKFLLLKDDRLYKKAISEWSLSLYNIFGI